MLPQALATFLTRSILRRIVFAAETFIAEAKWSSVDPKLMEQSLHLALSVPDYVVILLGSSAIIGSIFEEIL